MIFYWQNKKSFSKLAMFIHNRKPKEEKCLCSHSLLFSVQKQTSNKFVQLNVSPRVCLMESRVKIFPIQAHHKATYVYINSICLCDTN